MYSLIMVARNIPDGWTVRKPTGSKPYTLKHTIRLCGEKGIDVPEVKVAEDVFFLLSDNCISCVSGHRLLKIDYETLDDLQSDVSYFQDLEDLKDSK